MIITQAELKELLDYNPETGEFRWRVGRQGVKAGNVAGCMHKVSGYIYIGVAGRDYRSHRLAWLYVHGTFPSNHIDHINGDKLDNRISNLRDVTHRENNQNRRSHRNGRLVGACFHKPTGKWGAKIRVNGTQQSLGHYPTELEAHTAYVTALNQFSDNRGDMNNEGEQND